ncbi:Hypothetical protein SRAE_X000032850 [Strongyloides ratti]|uniref:Secreted protein n=1 Tax=Strongyloides ratti TaxID=34506 RepID=A0A090LMN4_STRRB|nr:Hypothetical protein SRAE_X000032850 [Strongyloides ratti]CEF71001.1 Hypothetical protein SRAE_X000032850 [Strongyloides ratti]
MNTLSSLVFIILIGLLFISKSYELNDQVLADNSLIVKDISIGVILNDEVDNHIIEKRQKRRKFRKNKKNNRKKNKKQSNVSVKNLLALITELKQKLNSVQPQISH